MKPENNYEFSIIFRHKSFLKINILIIIFNFYILSKMFLYDQNFLINMSFKIQYFINTESLKNET